MIFLAVLACILCALATYLCSPRQVLLPHRPRMSARVILVVLPGTLSLWAWADALGPVAGPCAGLVAWMLTLSLLPWALLARSPAQELS